MVYPHMRAFIETGKADPSVMMTVNHVQDIDRVDFATAMGGTRKDNGRKGIFVYLRWNEVPTMGEETTFTIWQRGAAKYGEPETLPEEGFDPAQPTELFEQGGIA